jgi:hypothetical protein
MQPPPWPTKFVVTTNGQVRTKKPLRASDTEGYRGVRGTSGRTRTGTLLRARDFESRVSTNSTTLAFFCSVDGQGDKPLPLPSQQAGDYSSDDVWVN